MELIQANELIEYLRAKALFAWNQIGQPYKPQSPLHTQEKWDAFWKGQVDAYESIELTVICWDYDPAKEPDVIFEGI